MTKLQRWLDVAVSLCVIGFAAYLVSGVLTKGDGPSGNRLPVPAEPVLVAGLPIDGDPQAPLGIVQFSEFQCPFCGSFSRTVLPELRQKYFDTGRAFIAFVHFPLENIHDRAFEAATLAACAAEQDVFWPFHDQIFSVPKPDLTEERFEAVLRHVGADRAAVASCVADRGPRAVRTQVRWASELDVVATPTFMFGVRESDGRLNLQSRFSGARSFPAFQEALESLAR